MSIKKLDKSGFTLIEVALAIAILGLGLSTLTALSTRLVDDTLHEINRTYASLLSNYLLELHLLENSNNNQTPPSNLQGSNQNPTQTANTQTTDSQTILPGAKNSSGSLTQKLSSYGYFDGINKEKETSYIDNKWTYEIKHEPINLPVTKDQFEMITTTVSWGKSSFDSVSSGIMVKISSNNN